VADKVIILRSARMETDERTSASGTPSRSIPQSSFYRLISGPPPHFFRELEAETVEVKRE